MSRAPGKEKGKTRKLFEDLKSFSKRGVSPSGARESEPPPPPSSSSGSRLRIFPPWSKNKSSNASGTTSLALVPAAVAGSLLSGVTGGPGSGAVQQTDPETKYRQEIWQTLEALKVIKGDHQSNERLGRIFKCMEDYAKIVDVAIQHSPHITALVWAGARWILMIASNAVQLMEVLGVTLAIIVEKMATCEFYAHIYQEARAGKVVLAAPETTKTNVDRLDNALKEFYEAVNTFVNRAKEYFDPNRSVIQKGINLLKPFSLWIQPCVEAMIEKEIVVKECAQMETMQRIKQGVEMLDQLGQRMEDVKKEMSSLVKLDDLLALAGENANVTNETLVEVRRLRDVVEKSLKPQQQEILDTSRSLDPELQKLKTKYLTDLENNFFEDNLYVATRGMTSAHAPESEHFDLTERLEGFITGDVLQKVCLIQGAAGSGKSTFNHHLARLLWANYDVSLADVGTTSTTIPLFISLVSLHDPTKPDQDLIHKFFVKTGWSELQIQEAREKIRFVFILDGYDEIQRRDRNFYIDNKLGDWKADCKVVISSRPEYLGSGYQSKFYPSRQQQLLQEYWIAPFSSENVKQYITKYTTAKGTQHMATYFNELVSKPEILALISNPFLLRMVMTVQPTINDSSAASVIQAKDLKRVTLYEAFLQHWLTQAQVRLDAIQLSDLQRQIFDTLCNEGAGFSWHVRVFCQSFAMELYRHHSLEATYIPTISKYSQAGRNKPQSQSSTADNWEMFLGNADELRLIRFSSPLVRNQQSYRFLHKSLRDYLVAQSLWEDTRALNDFDIVDDPGVIDFIVEHVHTDLDLQHRLEDCITASKTDPNVSRAAANAITILVRARWWFREPDFCNIRIPGADLSGGNFNSARMQNADLRGVRIRGTSLGGTDLSRAHMEGVWFGEKPHFKVEDGKVMALLHTPAGEILAAGTGYSTSDDHDEIGTKNVCMLWSVTQKRLVHAFHGHTDRIACVAFSPDGMWLASGAAWRDKNICLWSVPDLKAVHNFDHYSEYWGVDQVAFSPNATSTTKLLAATLRNTVKLWSLLDKTLVHSFDNLNPANLDSLVFVRFSPNTTHLVIAIHTKDDPSVSVDGAFGLKLYSLRDQKEITGSLPSATIIVPSDVVSITSATASPTFSPDGRLLAIPQIEQGIIQLWSIDLEAPNYYLNHTFKYTDQTNTAIDYLEISPDGQFMSVGYKTDIYIWSLWEHHLVHRIYNIDRVSIITFTRDSQTLFSYFNGLGKIQQLELIPNQKIQPYYAPELWNRARVSDIFVLPGAPAADIEDCMFLVSVSHDGDIRKWSPGRLSGPGECYSLTNYVSYNGCDPVFSPDGQMLALGSRAGTVRLWSVENGENIYTYVGHKGWVITVTFSPDGQMLASGGHDKTVRLWSVKNGENIYTYMGHKSWVITVTFSPDGQMLASGGHDKTVRLWSVENGENIYTYMGHTNWVTIVKFSPDGQMLASGSYDTTLRLWSVESGQNIYTYMGHTKTVATVTFSPDGQMLASGSHDTTIRLWSVENGGNIYTCTGHTDTVKSITFSPDSQIFVSQGDQRIGLCSVNQEGNLLASINFHDRISFLTWGSLPSLGAVVITGTDEGYVQVWKLQRTDNENTERISFDPVLAWSYPRNISGLHLHNCCIEGATGLEPEQIELLRQYGAIGEPAKGRVEELTE